MAKAKHAAHRATAHAAHAKAGGKDQAAQGKQAAHDRNQAMAPTVNQKNRAADKHDGTIHDPVMWNGQMVNYVKDVGNGDWGYNGSIQQSLITLPDGSEKVVPKAEILREATVSQTSYVPNRVPGGPRKV